MAKCKKCKGTGEWERIDKNLVCPDCNGKGVAANEPLDPKQQARIEKEAAEYASEIYSRDSDRLNWQNRRNGYIAGATAEHQKISSKAQELYNYIEAVTLRTVHQHSPHTQDIMRYLKNIIDSQSKK